MNLEILIGIGAYVLIFFMGFLGLEGGVGGYFDKSSVSRRSYLIFWGLMTATLVGIYLFFYFFGD
jgi:hypothetical protein